MKKPLSTALNHRTLQSELTGIPSIENAKFPLLIFAPFAVKRLFHFVRAQITSMPLLLPPKEWRGQQHDSDGIPQQGS